MPDKDKDKDRKDCHVDVTLLDVKWVLGPATELGLAWHFVVTANGSQYLVDPAIDTLDSEKRYDTAFHSEFHEKGCGKSVAIGLGATVLCGGSPAIVRGPTDAEKDEDAKDLARAGTRSIPHVIRNVAELPTAGSAAATIAHVCGGAETVELRISLVTATPEYKEDLFANFEVVVLIESECRDGPKPTPPLPPILEPGPYGPKDPTDPGPGPSGGGYLDPVYDTKDSGRKYRVIGLVGAAALVGGVLIVRGLTGGGPSLPPDAAQLPGLAGGASSSVDVTFTGPLSGKVTDATLECNRDLGVGGISIIQIKDYKVGGAPEHYLSIIPSNVGQPPVVIFEDGAGKQLYGTGVSAFDPKKGATFTSDLHNFDPAVPNGVGSQSSGITVSGKFTCP